MKFQSSVSTLSLVLLICVSLSVQEQGGGEEEEGSSTPGDLVIYSSPMKEIRPNIPSLPG